SSLVGEGRVRELGKAALSHCRRAVTMPPGPTQRSAMAGLPMSEEPFIAFFQRQERRCLCRIEREVGGQPARDLLHAAFLSLWRAFRAGRFAPTRPDAPGYQDQQIDWLIRSHRQQQKKTPVAGDDPHPPDRREPPPWFAAAAAEAQQQLRASIQGLSPE